MWIVGVVVRRYIDILIIIINFPYPLVLYRYYFGSSILTSLFIFKMFFRSEPHTYRTAAKNFRHVYIFVFYIYMYIYIYTFVRRARAVHARATRKRRAGRLRFNGQYNRLKNGYFSSKL